MHSDNHDHDHNHDRESAVGGLRRLIDLLLRVDADDPGLVPLVDELDRIIEMMGEPGSISGDHNPVSGKDNAIAPPLEVGVDAAGTVSTTGVLGLVHQGPKGLVHGGMSALMLNHVLRVAGTAGDESAVVQELSVRYHRPTPLFTELRVTATASGPAGARTRGEIEADGVTTVSAEASFAPPPLQ